MAITVTPGQAMTPQEWEALFAQHRGSASVVNISANKPLKDQILSGEDQRPIYRYYAADRSYVEARTAANGEDFEVVKYEPSKEYTESAPKAPEALSPGEQRQAELNRQAAANAALPPDQDPRYEDDATRAKRAVDTIAAQGAAARQGQQDARQTQIDADTRKRQQAADAAAATKAAEPNIQIKEVRQPDGSTKNVQVRVYPDGREVVAESAVPGQPAPREAITARLNPETGEYEEVYRDPTTGRAVVRAVPQEGAASRGSVTRAPSLPQIVVGESQDALRTAYDQIQEEVDSGRRTAAWGENRRKEVYEAARMTVSEAQIVEQSRQANQTTAFNQSSTLMSYGQNALEMALKYSLSVAGKLKPGSTAGADMFSALFSMQMKMARASGMYDVQGAQSSVGREGARAGVPGAAPQPKPRLTNPGDPAAVEADRQRAVAELEAAEAAGGPRAMTPSMGGPPQALPMRGGVPVTSTPAVAPAATPGGPAVPPPVPLPQPQPAPGAAPPAALPSTAPAPGFSDPRFIREPERPQPPLSGQDDPRLDRSPGVPGAPLTGPDDPRIQRESFPALDALRQQFAPPQQVTAQGGVDPTTGGIDTGMPPALQRAQIQAMPPWRLMDQIPDLLGQGIDEQDIYGWPGLERFG